MDGARFRTRLHLLPDRSVPRLRPAGRRRGRRRHLLRRLHSVHVRGSPAELAGLARAPLARLWPSRLVDGHHPVRRHPVLQRHHLSGDEHGAIQLEVRPARLEAGLAWIDLLPGVRDDRLRGLAPPGLVASPRRDGVVAAGGQPARVCLLRHLGRGRLCGAFVWFGARSGCGQLEHLTRCCVLPDLRRGRVEIPTRCSGDGRSWDGRWCSGRRRRSCGRDPRQRVGYGGQLVGLDERVQHPLAPDSVDRLVQHR